MITKGEFIELLNDRINWNDKVEQLCELLKGNFAGGGEILVSGESGRLEFKVPVFA